MSTKRSLNWTEADIAAHQARHGRKRVFEFVREKPEVQIVRQSGKLPNKTELRFERDYLKLWQIAGEITSYRLQSLTLLLANGLRYTPDAYTLDKSGGLSLYEIKGGGPMRDDSIAKMKMCADKYPEFPLWLYRWKGGEWLIQRIKT